MGIVTTLAQGQPWHVDNHATCENHDTGTLPVRQLDTGTTVALGKAWHWDNHISVTAMALGQPWHWENHDTCHNHGTGTTMELGQAWQLNTQPLGQPWHWKNHGTRTPMGIVTTLAQGQPWQLDNHTTCENHDTWIFPVRQLGTGTTIALRKALHRDFYGTGTPRAQGQPTALLTPIALREPWYSENHGTGTTITLGKHGNHDNLGTVKKMAL